MGKLKVLIVEDDRSLAQVLEYNLKREGYEVFSAYDGQDGMSQAQILLPDIVILDLMLPIMDGREVCRGLRAEEATRNTLILMLTAKAEESDELIGFSLGADDYVTKPFSVKILLERIKALLRHGKRIADHESDAITLHGIKLDRLRHSVSVNGVALQLTLSEFRLLETFIRQPGRVFQRNELIDAALGDAFVLERTIDVHIRALRRKLGEAAHFIETVRGVGYRFRVSSDSAE